VQFSFILSREILARFKTRVIGESVTRPKIIKINVLTIQSWTGRSACSRVAARQGRTLDRNLARFVCLINDWKFHGFHKLYAHLIILKNKCIIRFSCTVLSYFQHVSLNKYFENKEQRKTKQRLVLYNQTKFSYNLFNIRYKLN